MKFTPFHTWGTNSLRGRTTRGLFEERIFLFFFVLFPLLGSGPEGDDDQCLAFGTRRRRNFSFSAKISQILRILPNSVKFWHSLQNSAKILPNSTKFCQCLPNSPIPPPAYRSGSKFLICVKALVIGVSQNDLISSP